MPTHFQTVDAPPHSMTGAGTGGSEIVKRMKVGGEGGGGFEMTNRPRKLMLPGPAVRRAGFYYTFTMS